MGYSSSYNEALKFERCAAMVSGSELDGCLNQESILKFSADNVDHNLCTIDGRNTFHGMGMIASITNGSFASRHVPRLNVLDKDLLGKSHVPILTYRDKKYLLKNIKFTPPPPSRIIIRILLLLISFGKIPTILIILYLFGLVPCK